MPAQLPLISQLPKVYRRWQKDDGSFLAAAVAYYTALSFFPLLLVLISGLGLVMQYTAWGQDAEQQVLATIANYASAQVRDNVATMLDQVQEQAVLGGPLGLLALLFTAATLFAHFEHAFDRIWNVEDPATKGFFGAAKNLIFKRFRAFLMLLGIALLVLAIFIIGIVLSSLKLQKGWLPFSPWVWWLVEVGVSVTLNSFVFALLYRLLPKVPVRWSEALRGGLLAGVAWEVGRLVLATFVVADKYSPYGIVGSFIAIMLWIYFASTIIFLGAEYVQVICRDCQQRSPAG
jgi:membrane protein